MALYKRDNLLLLLLTMKRIAVIGFTAFYLLLTTGMFVCTMHCSAESVMTKATMQMAGNKGEKGCDCCKKHGSFVIKENLKPDFTVQFGQQSISVIPSQYTINYQAIAPVINAEELVNGKAPPWKSGRSISIRFRSFLI
jgi:hypothetical protein